MRSSNQSLVLTLILEDIAATVAMAATEVTEDTAAMRQATVDTEAMEATEAMAGTAAMRQAIVATVVHIPVQVAQELALQRLLLVQQECL